MPSFRDVCIIDGIWNVFPSRIIDDSALDPAVWANYRERRVVAAAAAGTELIVEQTDRYRGLALLAFRFFMIRRELAELDSCLRTGKAARTGMFEHPLTQTLLAIALLLGFARKTTYALGALFSLLIWATAEGFGGPYTVGAANMGTALTYVLNLSRSESLSKVQLSRHEMKQDQTRSVGFSVSAQWGENAGNSSRGSAK